MISVAIDTAQPRLKRDRIALTAGGPELAGEGYSNVWVDVVTQTLMLRPMALFDAWYTSNAGIYAKPTLASLEKNGGHVWRENEVYPGAGLFFQTTQSGDWLRTSSTIGRNRGVVLSFFANGSGDDYIALDCGWASTVDYTESVALRFRSGGTVEVWKGGDQIGRYSISGFEDGLDTTNQRVSLILLPMRRRELLVRSNRGGGFVHVFEDIAEDDADPTVTPDAKFWVQSQAGTLDVQFAPIKFPGSGYAYSLDGQFGVAPPIGATSEVTDADPVAPTVDYARVLGDVPYGGTGTVTAVSFRNLDGTAFVPDGAATQVKLKVDLAGDGDYTPYVYGVHMAYQAEWDDTDDSEEFDLTPRLMADAAPRLDVPDGPEPARLVIEANAPADLDGDVAKIETVASRPLELRWDGDPILSFVSQPSSLVYGVDDEGTRIMIEALDRSSLLREYQFSDPVPLDGLPLSHPTDPSAVRFVLRRAGIDPTEMDLDDAAFDLPRIAPRRCGDYNYLIEQGETGESALYRLRDEFAAGWAMGFKPTATGPKFWFKDIDALSATPVVTLYASQEDADAETAVDPEFYGDLRTHLLPVEANELRVYGLDPRTRKAIGAYRIDAASQDPAEPPSTRPDNWVGGVRKMGVFDPRITSDDAAARVVDTVFPVVSAARRMAEWTCLWPFVDDVPVWKWDVVRLFGVGDFRVASLSVSIEAEFGSYRYLPCRMTGVEIGTGVPQGKGGANLMAIMGLAAAAARDKTIRRPGYEQIAPFNPARNVLS
jgi:hypothetical protein